MVTALVPLAAGCEELEAVTLVDLLRRAGVEVSTAGLNGSPVTASRGTVLVPDTTLDVVSSNRFDLIALPGGLPGADHLATSDVLKHMLLEQDSRRALIGAICAAPRVLAKHGLLDGRQATAFPGSLDERALPDVCVVDHPVVVDGHIVTSRGPGTALDFALKLIELLAGEDARDDVEGPLQRPRHHLTRELPAH